MLLKRPLENGYRAVLGLKVRFPKTSKEVSGTQSASFPTHILKTGQDGMSAAGHITKASKSR